MKLFWTAFGVLLLYNVSAQSKLIGLHLSAGSCVTTVNDEDGSTSGGLNGNGYLNNPADGLTDNEKNQTAYNVGLLLELPASDKLYFSTGLLAMGKSFSLRNTDGNYSGASTYTALYLQVPLAAKLYVAEPSDGLKLYAKLGLSLDFKAREGLKGNDRAHYWNLAKNYTYNDPVRGKNGNGKSMDLINPLNIGILGAFGAEYELMDDVFLFGAISFNAGLLNMINPALRHNDVAKTKVTEGLMVRTSTIGLDLGVSIPLK